jgi:hypothetical protein
MFQTQQIQNHPDVRECRGFSRALHTEIFREELLKNDRPDEELYFYLAGLLVQSVSGTQQVRSPDLQSKVKISLRDVPQG